MKTVTTRLVGEDENIYLAVKHYFNRGPARIKDSEIVRACIRYFYEKELSSDPFAKRKEKEEKEI